MKRRAFFKSILGLTLVIPSVTEILKSDDIEPENENKQDVEYEFGFNDYIEPTKTEYTYGASAVCISESGMFMIPGFVSWDDNDGLHPSEPDGIPRG